MDRSSKRITIAPCTVVGDLPLLVCQKIGITDASQYVLYAYLNERFYMLFPEEYVLDTVFAGDANAHDKKAKPVPRKLYLKKIVWRRNENPVNQQSVNMMFSQIVDFYMTGFTRPSQNDCVNYACLLTRVAGVDFDSKDAVQREELMREYIPALSYQLLKPSVWIRDVDSLMGCYKTMDATTAKLRFIEYAQGWALYGASVYQLTDPKCDKIPLPDEIVLVLCPSNVLVLHPVSKVNICIGVILSFRTLS
jgi:FERM central domain